MHRKNTLTPSWPLFLQSNILPLRHLFIYKVLVIFYNKCGDIPFTESRHSYNLRLIPTFRIPKHFLTFYKQSIEFIGPKMYSKIPNIIRKSKSLAIFKRNVKIWLFCNNNVECLLNSII